MIFHFTTSVELAHAHLPWFCWVNFFAHTEPNYKLRPALIQVIQTIWQFNFYTNPYLKVNHLAILTSTLSSSHHRMYCILPINKETFKPTWNSLSAVQISRVRTPPIPSAHSSHPSFWNQTLVTLVEHLWTLCCVSVALQRSIPWGNRRTTVNWN